MRSLRAKRNVLIAVLFAFSILAMRTDAATVAIYSELEQINNEIVYLLCKGLLANPCREIVARRIHFATKQQSQA
jgi:hypothetical protein